MIGSLDDRISRILSSGALAAAVMFSHPAYANEVSSGYRAADPAKGPCPEYICGPSQQPPQQLPLPPQKPKEEPCPDYICKSHNNSFPSASSTENSSEKVNAGKGFIWLLGGVTVFGLGYVVGREAAPDNTVCERDEHEKCDATSGQVFSLLLLGAGVVGVSVGIYYLTK